MPALKQRTRAALIQLLRCRGAVFFSAWLAVGTVRAAIHVPLTVAEFSGVARTNEWVRSGVPFPRRENLLTAANLRVVGPGGSPVSARCTVLGRWGAGPTAAAAPVRWVLVGFPATVAANGTNVYFLTDAGAGPAMTAVSVVEDAAAVTVTTGPAQFRIPKTNGALLESVRLDLDADGVFSSTEEILSPANDAGPFVGANGVEFRAQNAAPLSVAVEDSGPGVVTVRLEGFHISSGTNQLLRYVSRLTFRAGSADVRLNHTIIEGRVSGSFEGEIPGPEFVTPLTRAGLRWRLNLGGAVAARVTADSPTPRVVPLTANDTAAVRQRTPTNYLQLACEVLVNGAVVESGARARQAALALADNRWGVAVATRDFYRKGPQRLAASGDGTVTIEFPSEDYTIYMAMGWMEEVLLQFHPAARPFSELHAQAQGGLKDPLFAVAPASWYCGSGALGELSPAPAARYPAYDSVLESHFQQTVAWVDAGRCFGLLNYLDLPIDRWDGSTDPHEISYGNSYYDAPGAQVREFARRAEFRWLRELAFPHIRHWFTTDCFEADYALHRFNGISCHRGVAHRGGFTGEYHYMESLWDYYYLTGDRRALERGRAAARSYATAACWRNEFELGIPTSGLTGRSIAQKLNTLFEAYLASGDESLRATLVTDAEDYLAVNGTAEGFLRNSRSQPSIYATDQGFMCTVLILPSLWKYQQLTGSPAARAKLILTPQRILNSHRLSANPAAPEYYQFYNQLTVTATGGGNFTTQPLTNAFFTTDDYMYDQGVQGLVTALCRAAVLSGDRSLVAQARLLYENRLAPAWFGDIWAKPPAQQTLRAAPGVAYLGAPETPERARFTGSRPTAGDRLNMDLTGSFGHAYRLQATADLLTWTTLSTNAPAPNGALEVYDAGATNRPQRFYRVISP